MGANRHRLEQALLQHAEYISCPNQLDDMIGQSIREELRWQSRKDDVWCIGKALAFLSIVFVCLTISFHVAAGISMYESLVQLTANTVAGSNAESELGDRQPCATGISLFSLQSSDQDISYFESR